MAATTYVDTMFTSIPERLHERPDTWPDNVYFDEYREGQLVIHGDEPFDAALGDYPTPRLPISVLHLHLRGVHYVASGRPGPNGALYRMSKPARPDCTSFETWAHHARQGDGLFHISFEVVNGSVVGEPSIVPYHQEANA